MILTVTLNTSVDQTLFVESLRPGDTNRVSHCEMDAGGKGVNLSRVAHSLGGKTLVLGFAGGPARDYLKGLLDQDEVPNRLTKTTEPTRTNINIENEDGTPPTTLNSKGPLISPKEWEAFCEQFQEAITQANWICLCGSIPPGLEKSAYRDLAEMAKGKRVLIDADGEALSLGIMAKPDLIKPNKNEAERLLGRPVSDPIADATILRDMSGGQFAMLSLGKEGAVLATGDRIFIGKSPPIEAVSTIGSGDSMLGAFLARLEAGDPPALAFQWGLAAGAATATTDGKQIAHSSVIELLFDRATVRQVG